MDAADPQVDVIRAGQIATRERRGFVLPVCGVLIPPTARWPRTSWISGSPRLLRQGFCRVLDVRVRRGIADNGDADPKP